MSQTDQEGGGVKMQKIMVISHIRGNTEAGAAFRVYGVPPQTGGDCGSSWSKKAGNIRQTRGVTLSEPDGSVSRLN